MKVGKSVRKVDDYYISYTKKQEKTPVQAKKSAWYIVYSWLDSLVFAIIIILVVFSFVLRIVGVNGDSMNPTLENGQWLTVKAINQTIDRGDIVVITNKGTGKRVKLTEFEKSTRARRGLMLVREVKANPYKIVKTFTVDAKEYIGIKTKGKESLRKTELDKYSLSINTNKYLDKEVHGKQNIYGLKRISLNNMSEDTTFLKDYLSYYLMAELGLCTPYYSLAELSACKNHCFFRELYYIHQKHYNLVNIEKRIHLYCEILQKIQAFFEPRSYLL